LFFPNELARTFLPLHAEAGSGIRVIKLLLSTTLPFSGGKAA
jgi:hypothetical protein